MRTADRFARLVALIAAVLAAFLLGTPSFAQAVLQAGPPFGGHAAMYAPGPTVGSPAALQDSGPAGSFNLGQGLSEMLQVNRLPGTGPFGSHNCSYDQPSLTGPNGAHFLCLDANALGGGLLSYGAIGNATPLPFQCDINGLVSPCFVPSTAGTNVLTYGAVCGGADSTAAFNSAVASMPSGGQLIVPSCTFNIAGTVTLTNNIRMSGVGAIYYPGMVDETNSGTPTLSTWPPPSGPAINCTGANAPACIKIGGTGIEIDHINFGNPQPTPAFSGPVNGWSPTVFPSIIQATAAVNWNGLHLHDLSFTSAYQCISLQGTPNYETQGISGAQWTINDIWANPCLSSTMKLTQIDNTGRISNVDMDFWWNRNVPSVAYWMENNSVGVDSCYLANAQFNNIEFLYNKVALQFTNCTVVPPTKTLAAVNLQFDNIDFNLPCQAVAIPGGNGTFLTAIFTNIIAYQDNSWCLNHTAYQTGFAPIFFDFSSDNADIHMSSVRAHGVQTFAAIGHGAGGNLNVSDINIDGYSNYAAGAAAFMESANSHFTLFGTDFAAIVPQTGAGPLEGAGVDSTRAFMQPVAVGSGAKPGEGGVLLTGSGTRDSGTVQFFPCPTGCTGGTANTGRNGYVGASNNLGVNLAADTGSIFLQPNAASGTAPHLTVGSSGTNLTLNVNPLPTTPPSGTGVGFLCFDNAGNVYAKATCP